MSKDSELLNVKQMAEFTANGFLRFDEVIPRELCEKFYDYLRDPKQKIYKKRGQLLWDTWEEGTPVYEFIRHPIVKGLIYSLVGRNPRYDHHFPHETRPGSRVQALHQDAEFDPRRTAFDIQISFFPQDTPKLLGGTRFLPSSHFRKVNESVIGRYQHIKGMVQCECKAGTVVVWHTDLWHGAQPNQSQDQIRYMFKLRLNPMERQQKLFDTTGYDSQEVRQILSKRFTWHGQSSRREEFMRARFWRELTGQYDFDLDMWNLRNEAIPTNRYFN